MGCYAPVTTDYCAFSTNTEISCYCTEPNCQPSAPPNDLLDVPEFAESPSNDNQGRFFQNFQRGLHAEAYSKAQAAVWSSAAAVAAAAAIGTTLGRAFYLFNIAL